MFSCDQGKHYLKKGKFENNDIKEKIWACFML